MIFTTACAGCNQPGDLLCHRCRFALVSAPSPVDGQPVVAALPFEGVARQVVLGLKYRNRRGVARLVARLMVRRLRPGRVDLVTWAPTGPSRARERGYDQAELLARAVARELRVPCRRLLYRTHGAPQTGRSRSERLNGPRLPCSRPPGRVEGPGCRRRGHHRCHHARRQAGPAPGRGGRGDVHRRCRHAVQ